MGDLAENQDSGTRRRNSGLQFLEGKISDLKESLKAHAIKSKEGNDSFKEELISYFAAIKRTQNEVALIQEQCGLFKRDFASFADKASVDKLHKKALVSVAHLAEDLRKALDVSHDKYADLHKRLVDSEKKTRSTQNECDLILLRLNEISSLSYALIDSNKKIDSIEKKHQLLSDKFVGLEEQLEDRMKDQEADLGFFSSKFEKGIESFAKESERCEVRTQEHKDSLDVLFKAALLSISREKDSILKEVTRLESMIGKVGGDVQVDDFIKQVSYNAKSIEMINNKIESLNGK